MGYNIETLMREYGNDVLRTAYSYVKDRFTAEDIFQDVFIKAYINSRLHISFVLEAGLEPAYTNYAVNDCV